MKRLTHTMGEVRYLSQEWITAADAALRNSDGDAPSPGLVIDQHVEGATAYRVTIGDTSGVQVIENDDGQADAVFRQDIATATAVAQGTTDAHQAFLLGHITFEGNIDVLIERRDAFDWLHAALAPVLAQTTFV